MVLELVLLRQGAKYFRLRKRLRKVSKMVRTVLKADKFFSKERVLEVSLKNGVLEKSLKTWCYT